MQNETSYKLSIDWLNVTMSPREKYKMGADGQPIFTSKGKKMIADIFYDIDWSDRAENIIAHICADLELGTEVPARKTAQGDTVNPLGKLGYNVCKQYGDVLIGYHKRFEYMGIIIQLSGDACRSYRCGFDDVDKRVPELVLLSKLNAIATANDYMCAPTRVDIALDEYNGLWSVPQYVDSYYLQPQAEERKPYIYTYKVRTNVNYMPANVSTSAIMSNGATLYVGSAKSACRLRIYDKLAERTSADVELPADVERWTRYEIMVRKEYARGIGDALDSIAVTDNNSYMRCLASVLATKYVLCEDVDGLRKHYIMEYLDSVAEGTKTILKADDRRKSTLVTSYGHIVGGAGLIGLAQRMVAIHDDKDASDLVDALLTALKHEILTAPISDETARAISKADKSVDVLPADVLMAYDLLHSERATD